MNLFEMNETVSYLEKNWKFDEAIKILNDFIEQMEKTAKVRTSTSNGIKTVSWNSDEGSISVSWAFDWIGKIYLKIGTQNAIDYYTSLKSNKYNEKNSDFETMLLNGLYNALEKQSRGYVYKPQTKADQQAFLEFAKTKGWR